MQASEETAMTDPIIDSFPAERIVVGEHEDGTLAVLITDAGRDAAAEEGLPVDCDLCRGLFQTGDSFYRVAIGIDDAPDVVGAAPGSHNLVESTTELTLCKGCERKAAPLVDQLLEALWALRAPDPETQEPPTGDGCDDEAADDTPPTVKS